MAGSLSREFFARPAVEVAPELVGMRLEVGGSGGVIVETEAYEQDDPACHAFGGITDRTSVLYGPPGYAYVYLCYGIHRMLNVSTCREGVAGAVLIRAIEPTDGKEVMSARRGRDRDKDLCSGPGKLCEALAIELAETGDDLTVADARIRIGPRARSSELIGGPRIGISRAVEHPWRWCEAGSLWLSAPAG